MARLVLGPDHVRLLPVTAIAGSIFLVLADTLARTMLAPSEIPVGLLTAFIGGPFFLYLLRRNKREYTLCLHCLSLCMCPFIMGAVLSFITLTSRQDRGTAGH